MNENNEVRQTFDLESVKIPYLSEEYNLESMELFQKMLPSQNPTVYNEVRLSGQLLLISKSGKNTKGTKYAMTAWRLVQKPKYEDNDLNKGSTIVVYEEYRLITTIPRKDSCCKDMIEKLEPGDIITVTNGLVRGLSNIGNYMTVFSPATQIRLFSKGNGSLPIAFVEYFRNPPGDAG